jgi:hypothetical protein
VVEGVGLRADELGRLRQSDLTNGSMGGETSWRHEVVVDAAPVCPFVYAGDPSLGVRVSLEALPALSLVRRVALSCTLHEHEWELGLAAAFELRAGNVTGRSVDLTGLWSLGGAVVLSVAQVGPWASLWVLNRLSVVVHGGNGTGWSVAAPGSRTVRSSG